MAYQQYTLAALRDLLRQRWNGNPFWQPVEEPLYLNEGVRTWQMLTGYWRRQITVETIAGELEYSLPATMLYRLRVAHQSGPMRPTSLTSLDRARPSWMSETTATGGEVPTRPIFWAPVSLTIIHVWPAPAVAHQVFTIDGLSATPVLAAETDYLDLGSDVLDVLLGYALHAASFKRQGVWFEQTWPWWMAFLQAAVAQNSLIKTSQAYRRAMAMDRQRQQQPLQQAPTLLDDMLQVVGAQAPKARRTSIESDQ